MLGLAPKHLCISCTCSNAQFCNVIFKKTKRNYNDANLGGCVVFRTCLGDLYQSDSITFLMFATICLGMSHLSRCVLTGRAQCRIEFVINILP